VPQLGPTARTISDVHALIVACTHRVAHHFDSELPLFLYDIDLLCRGLDEPSWNRVRGLISEKRIRSVCARSLSLANDLFGTPVPTDLVAAPRNIEQDEPTAAYLRRALRRIDILRSDLSALGWRSRLQLLREHLLPSPAYMLASYGQRRMSLLPVLYIHRVLHGAFEWFRPLGTNREG